MLHQAKIRNTTTKKQINFGTIPTLFEKFMKIGDAIAHSLKIIIGQSLNSHLCQLRPISDIFLVNGIKSQTSQSFANFRKQSLLLLI